MSVIITELIARANTGISVKPFICRTEEGREIFVKPAGTMKRSLIVEWIGGRLAQIMRLPCAEISAVEVPEELAKANRNPEWTAFQAGAGFGSYSLRNRYRDLQASDLERLPKKLLAEIYAFDYWIQNQDRTMGVVNGNPNALVTYDVTEALIIDHDNAFDSDFPETSLLNLHLGRSSRHYWSQRKNQQSWMKKASKAVAALEKIWDEIPEEWVYSDLDNEVPSSYRMEHYQAIL